MRALRIIVKCIPASHDAVLAQRKLMQGAADETEEIDSTSDEDDDDSGAGETHPSRALGQIIASGALWFCMVKPSPPFPLISVLDAPSISMGHPKGTFPMEYSLL